MPPAPLEYRRAPSEVRPPRQVSERWGVVSLWLGVTALSLLPAMLFIGLALDRAGLRQFPARLDPNAVLRGCAICTILSVAFGTWGRRSKPGRRLARAGRICGLLVLPEFVVLGTFLDDELGAEIVGIAVAILTVYAFTAYMLILFLDVMFGTTELK